MIQKYSSLIILGSGPAGYTAAIYAARANLHPLVITGIQPGGQLINTFDIANWPGIFPGITGECLMSNIKKHAEQFGTQVIIDHIYKSKLKIKPIMLHGDKYTYTCDALIIATGASAKYLEISSEKQFIGKGVSACATCDGTLYKNKIVAVIGGGNTAVEETLYLSNIAKIVHLIHRRDKLSAEPIMQDKLLKQYKQKGNIIYHFNTIINEMIGNTLGITSVMIKNINTEIIRNLQIDGLFIAIGNKPNTELFKGQLNMENGYLIIKNGNQGNVTQTNIKGIFAAGDVTDKCYRQAITSAGSGCMAAIDAAKYLNLNILSI